MVKYTLQQRLRRCLKINSPWEGILVIGFSCHHRAFKFDMSIHINSPLTTLSLMTETGFQFQPRRTDRDLERSRWPHSLRDQRFFSQRLGGEANLFGHERLLNKRIFCGRSWTQTSVVSNSIQGWISKLSLGSLRLENARGNGRCNIILYLEFTQGFPYFFFTPLTAFLTFTWRLSSAMAVSVRVDTCREQYCTNRLMWHMPLPNTQLLFTKRTWG